MAMLEGIGLELRLGLGPWNGSKKCDGNVEEMMQSEKKKRVFTELSSPSGVVGWPPVCSYRKKMNVTSNLEKLYVKVSMDGAPILRKIDLSVHKDYSDLIMALEKLFACFGLGEELKDAEDNEYVPIYEDEDGDWMLVGDVPWEMFTKSCKRLRIMKRADIKDIGLYSITKRAKKI